MSANPDAMAAFEKAVDGLTGYVYEPLALLGSQVVAGMNYQILCRSAAVVPDAVPTRSAQRGLSMSLAGC